jgi:hypothetical protein
MAGIFARLRPYAPNSVRWLARTIVPGALLPPPGVDRLIRENPEQRDTLDPEWRVRVSGVQADEFMVRQRSRYMQIVVEKIHSYIRTRPRMISPEQINFQIRYAAFLYDSTIEGIEESKRLYKLSVNKLFLNSGPYKIRLQKHFSIEIIWLCILALGRTSLPESYDEFHSRPQFPREFRQMVLDADFNLEVHANIVVTLAALGADAAATAVSPHATANDPVEIRPNTPVNTDPENVMNDDNPRSPGHTRRRRDCRRSRRTRRRR